MNKDHIPITDAVRETAGAWQNVIQDAYPDPTQITELPDLGQEIIID
jgi:hypothetical protein